MKIQEMFYKEIDRDIKGVIKVGQKDQENIYQELDEYVVTDELDKYMNKFFDAYERGLTGRTDKMGVWISGFFGSGKSHFLKILSYILSDKKVKNPDKPEDKTEYAASSFFMNEAKVPDKKLQEKIKRAASYAEDTDVILFNVDSKSASDSKVNKEAIKDVFMKVFNEHLGYCGSIPFLAEFERKLDDDGKYEAFKEKFEEINGDSWENSREDFYFIQDEIIEAIFDLGIMSEDAAKNWANNAESSYRLSIEQFANYVKKYCAKKGENHHVIFLVDEIGQYIADDSKLMVNLQTVAEDLGTACQGKVWIAVTSQQDIDSITKTLGDDFSKIQGRFDTRVSLSSADVAEVIRKRILYKNDKATELLKSYYEKVESIIERDLTFSEGTPHMPLYEDAEEFAEVYPFIPYQFKLLGDVLTTIRQYSSSGKNMADGERSMLALFKEAAQKYKDDREGILVPFNAFYSAVDDFIDHQHRIVITGAARNPRLDSFDVELLKVLFMIKHVESFKGTVENLTTLMISEIGQDILTLHNRVDDSLKRLCDELLVQKNGDRYVFLTNEEQEAENKIRSINIDSKETQNHIAAVAFEEIIALPNNKYKYNNRYSFSFNTQIDDRFYRNNSSNGITLRIMTAYSGDKSEAQLSMLSTTENGVIVRLDDDYPYIAETEMMRKIESFLNSPDLATMSDYEVIRVNKQRERKEASDRVKMYIRMALESAQIYVRGARIDTKSKDVTSRINEAFGKLIDSVYSKLKNMETEPSLSDIQSLLKQTKTQMTLNLSGIKEQNEEALRDVAAKIEYADRSGIKMSMKQMLDDFQAAPYGYTEEDIEYLVATLYKKGKISLKINSVIYSPATTAAEEAFKYLTKRDFREKVLLELKAVPKNAWIKSVKEVIHDFLGHTPMTDDSDSLMRDFKSYCVTKKSFIEETLRDDYKKGSPLPGKDVLEKAERLINDVDVIKDPMTFYKRVDELYDDFKEVSDELVDLIGFLDGPQKEKFLHAYNSWEVFEKSKNFIVDQTIIDYANQIKKITSIKEPYSFIKKLEEYDRQLIDGIGRLLEQDAKKIRPEVEADHKLVLDEIDPERPYAARLKNSINEKFEDVLKKVDTTHDMATMNGIPAESNALVEICLRQISEAEADYQRSVTPVTPAPINNDDDAPEKPVATQPVKPVVRTVPVTMRSLTKNKTYNIKSKDDVEIFLSDIREKLLEQLKDDTIIRLS